MLTTMPYIFNDPIFAKEKAYDIDFIGTGVPGLKNTNHSDDSREITVNEITDFDKWDLDKNGFCIIKTKTDLDPQAALTRPNDVRHAYWYELEAILHKTFPEFKRIDAWDFTVRVRDVDFPKIVEKDTLSHTRPAGRPHCDYSHDGMYRILRHVFPGQAPNYEHKEFDIINVWRVLEGPNNDWPLAMCDWESVDPETDIRLNDVIRRTARDENSILHYSDKHKWYYIKDQMPEDLLVFRNADTTGKRPRAFHCGVYGPNSTSLRSSVEVRLIAFR